MRTPAIATAAKPVPQPLRVAVGRRNPLATRESARYRLPFVLIPSGKISFQAARKRFISSSVPIETRR